jgi:hypothetical protein
MLHIQHLLSGAGTIGQLVADVPSELCLTPPHETKTNKESHENPSRHNRCPGRNSNRARPEQETNKYAKNESKPCQA